MGDRLDILVYNDAFEFRTDISLTRMGLEVSQRHLNGRSGRGRVLLYQ